ncbi:MAG: DNA polymerase III subunit delta, partial [Treponema sp.]|nr:DNA polymerase III subunit delta [Treponema sp.]
FAAMADPTASPKDRLESSMGILQKIRLSKDSSGTALLAGLTYCFRQLRSWQALHAGQESPTESQLRAAGFSGKKKQAQYAGAARIWGAGAAASILSLIASTDMDIRSGGTMLEDTSLVLLLHGIIIKNGVYPAKYE